MGNEKGAKYDAGKIDLTLVPPDAIEMVAQVRMFGVSKYGDAENWKTLEPERWDKALDRHLNDYHKDPYSVDPESGLFTFKHVLCNAMFIASSRAKNAPVGLEFNPQTAPKGWKVRYVCPYCGTGFEVPHSQCPCCLKEV